ncbi:hypothetical protein PAXINDRAFT_8539 [Paxillus involutus ATCC 200175]|nr:hypothetical protein PAXINDRAFT_8539 [Paxillus involutus ATCC 200175]
MLPPAVQCPVQCPLESVPSNHLHVMIAQVSPDSGARNLDVKEYQSQLGSTILRLWDTVRLQEPESMATKASLKRPFGSSIG